MQHRTFLSILLIWIVFLCQVTTAQDSNPEPFDPEAEAARTKSYPPGHIWRARVTPREVDWKTDHSFGASFHDNKKDAEISAILSSYAIEAYAKACDAIVVSQKDIGFEHRYFKGRFARTTGYKAGVITDVTLKKKGGSGPDESPAENGSEKDKIETYQGDSGNGNGSSKFPGGTYSDNPLANAGEKGSEDSEGEAKTEQNPLAMIGPKNETQDGNPLAALGNQSLPGTDELNDPLSDAYSKRIEENKKRLREIDVESKQAEEQLEKLLKKLQEEKVLAAADAENEIEAGNPLVGLAQHNSNEENFEDLLSDAAEKRRQIVKAMDAAKLKEIAEAREMEVAQTTKNLASQEKKSSAADLAKGIVGSYKCDNPYHMDEYFEFDPDGTGMTWWAWGDRSARHKWRYVVEFTWSASDVDVKIRYDDGGSDAERTLKIRGKDLVEGARSDYADDDDENIFKRR